MLTGLTDDYKVSGLMRVRHRSGLKLSLQKL